MSEACNLFTVDVEDWYCILDVGGPEVQEWASLECRLHSPIRELLKLLEETKTHALFFVLGWVAEHYPGIVREIAKAGHEIGSHGYSHTLIYKQTPEEFRQDVCESKDAIEKATGKTPVIYRAPGCSITPQTPWAFEILAKEGFTTDSSIFPARRGHGGWPGFCPVPCRIMTKSGTLLELPISTCSMLGKRLPFSGGGYLRLLPYRLVRRMARKLNRSGTPVVFYIHPREMDSGHPRLPMGLRRRFKSYVGLRSTLPKTRRLLADFRLTPLAELLESLDSENLPVIDMH